jgi:hypothetical protein
MSPAAYHTSLVESLHCFNDPDFVAGSPRPVVDSEDAVGVWLELLCNDPAVPNRAIAPVR